MSNPVVRMRTFSQADFDRFAQLSGDDNPIHVDAAFSANSRFGKTVAHGVLLCSQVRSLIQQMVPDAMLGQFQVMYPAPTYAGDEMAFEVRETQRAEGQVRLEFVVTRAIDEVVTCQGWATTRLASR